MQKGKGRKKKRKKRKKKDKKNENYNLKKKKKKSSKSTNESCLGKKKNVILRTLCKCLSHIIGWTVIENRFI